MEKPRKSDNLDGKHPQLDRLQSDREGEYNNNPRKFMESFLGKIAEIKRINRVGDEPSVNYHKGNLLSELGEMEEMQLPIMESNQKIMFKQSCID